MTTPSVFRRSARIAANHATASLTKSEKDFLIGHINYSRTLGDCYHLLQAFLEDVIDVLGGLPKHEDDECVCDLTPEQLKETIAALRKGIRLLIYFFKKMALCGANPLFKDLIEDKTRPVFTEFYYSCLDLQSSMRNMRTGQEYEPLSGNRNSKAEHLYDVVYDMYKRVQCAYIIGI